MDQHQTPLPFEHVAAPVSQAQAARLVDYDHHRARVGGKLGAVIH
jgi:hypothetical protein